jgi:hypothetical protein
LFRSTTEGYKAPDGCECATPITEKSIGSLNIGKLEKELP